MPRRAALEALERFRRDSAWSRQVMSTLIRKYNLDGRDGALAARLFYGTLQNLILLDYYLDIYARGRLEPKVRDILRLGAYQLLFMDKVPPSAAVNEAVSQCKKYAPRAAGLVNAVLRRMAADRDRSCLPPLPTQGGPEYLTVKYSHPRWMVEELMEMRGYDGAEAVLRANNEPPPIYVQTNTLKTTTEELAAQLRAEPFGNIPGCLRMPRQGRLEESEPFAQGLYYVQDPAAHSVVLAAGLQPGMTVLDACAAPGGKSFAAAIAMEDGGHVLARDINSKKLALVRSGAERLGLSSIQCQPGDARDASGAFDVVLADLPCSGLGVIRKKPDIRYRLQEELDAIPDLQIELLDALAETVRPGGRLVYSTCTWRAGENQAVAWQFLSAHREFVKSYERVFWPDMDETDGFYICRMERISLI
ncbi:MAG: 16S rRNA (cytosine(967)-C(5))-methyltransferase RsmB [Oscillospiraceae bacterium]|nr:16S rRNA (cytosine(967)-C(5))-methyltransferase RsmB [Oscillospiraceae bacterium]